jgi:hypothetical protein
MTFASVTPIMGTSLCCVAWLLLRGTLLHPRPEILIKSAAAKSKWFFILDM